MLNPLAPALTFLVGSLAGCVLLAVTSVAAGVITVATYLHARSSSGIGAVAGGVSASAVSLVPLLSGVIAVLLANRRHRVRSSSGD